MLSLARLPYVLVPIPTAPEPVTVVDAVLMLKMEKVLVALLEVAKENALARSFFRVDEAWFV